MDSATCASLLRQFASTKALEDGKRLHSAMKSTGQDRFTYLSNHLVQMYGKCGSLADARAVFEGMHRRNVFSWNIMISVYIQSGHSRIALKLFYRMMQVEDVEPDMFTFASVVGACGDLAEGKRVHASIAASQVEADVVLGNALVSMYAKLGSLADARKVFEGMLRRDVVSWNAMVAACAQNGHFEEMLRMFRLMDSEGVQPDDLTFVSVLGACSSLGFLAEGKAIHSRVAALGFELQGVQNALLSMYAECGELDAARNMFERMHRRSIVSWTVLIAAYAEHGHSQKALELYFKMEKEGVQPDSFMFATILAACSSPQFLTEGRAIHNCILEYGFQSDTVVGTALVNMYARCGSLGDARAVFIGMQHKDVVSWNAMISAYAQDGYHSQDAIQLYLEMHLEGIKLNNGSFVSTVSACSSLGDLELGRGIHQLIVAAGFDSETLKTALLDMYAKCDSLEDAKSVSDKLQQRNVVSWTAMIGAYTRNGHTREAVQLYHQMSSAGIQPDKFTFANVLAACSSLSEGKEIHAQIVERGFESDTIVGTALIEMHARCGSISKAKSCFQQIHEKDAISWNVILAAHAQHGDNDEVLQLYYGMEPQGAEPNAVTFVNVLGACSNKGALAEGKLIHDLILARELDTDVAVMTALVNMYGKCGDPVEARNVFDRMQQKNVVTWNGMVTAYAKHGHSSEALELFLQMILDGVEPNDITFTSILQACSHTGLLGTGLEYYRIMKQDYGVYSLVEHHIGIVDLLGRAGWLEEAEELIQSLLPSLHETVAWTSLLSACKVHGDTERGTRVADMVLEEKAGAYVLLSNMYTRSTQVMS